MWGVAGPPPQHETGRARAKHVKWSCMGGQKEWAAISRGWPANKCQIAETGPVQRRREKERRKGVKKQGRKSLRNQHPWPGRGTIFALANPFLGDGSKVCGLLGGLLRPPAVASVTLGVQAWTWSRLDTHPVVKGWACAWVSGRPDTEINRPPGNLCLQNLPQGWQGLGLSWLSLSASSIIVLSLSSFF